MQLTETDKAYLAGIIDGEGYVTIHARTVKYGKSCQPKLMITSTSIKWLSDLRASVGNLGAFSAYGSKGKNCKPYAQWSVIGKAAQELLNEAYPYLRIKKEQAWIVINFKMVGQGKRRTTEQIEHQTDFFNRVKILNRRGLQEPILMAASEMTTH